MRGKREKGREKEGGLLLPLFEQGEMGGGKTESGRERKRERRERAAKKRAAGVPDPDCERDDTARAPPPPSAASEFVMQKTQCSGSEGRNDRGGGDDGRRWRQSPKNVRR